MTLRPDSAREKITAGKRNRVLTIERYTLTRNEDNEPIEKWVELAQVWAAKTDISDGEKLRAAQVGSTVTTRFQVEWLDVLADISGKDRLNLEGQIYDISGVKELGTRDGIEITASRQTDGGPTS